MPRQLNIHEKIALLYFLMSLPLIAVLLIAALFDDGFDQNRCFKMIEFTCSLSVTIAAAPAFLKIEIIRRNFNWLDALTPEQKNWLFNFGLVEYHKNLRTPDYFSQVKPYMLNIELFGIVAMLMSGQPIKSISYGLSVLGLAVLFYVLGVLAAIIATIALFQKYG